MRYPTSRPPLMRMRLIRLKLKKGEPFNANTLARELEVTPKTIQRDIDFLRDQLGYDIEFHVVTNSYKGKVPEMPVL